MDGLQVPEGVSPARAAFLTHSNYLRAFCTIMEAEYVDGWPLFIPQGAILSGLATHVRSGDSLRRLKVPETPVDFDLLRRTLRNAWGTELLLAGPIEDELVSVANNWSVVQAYYACYQVVQALTAARGRLPLTSHAKLQTEFSSTWIVKSVRLTPWSFGFKLGEVANPPLGVTFERLHSWKNVDSDSCWSIARLALERTRDVPLKRQQKKARENKKAERVKAWKMEGEAKARQGKILRKKKPTAMPNLKLAEREQIDKKLRATSIVDYLYRLRMRSNYEDPTMFTDGPEDLRESREVHRNLSTITAATLLLHELHVRELVGHHQFDTLVTAWLRDSGSSNLGLRARQGLLLDS